MNTLISLLATIALLGSALIGGIFFAFSSFVMKALARVPSSEGIAVMQSINVAVINPSFMTAFMGTALLSLGIAGITLFRWSHPSSSSLLGGAILYLAGTLLVTMLGNVPLNEQLAPCPQRRPLPITFGCITWIGGRCGITFGPPPLWARLSCSR